MIEVLGHDHGNAYEVYKQLGSPRSLSITETMMMKEKAWETEKAIVNADNYGTIAIVSLDLHINKGTVMINKWQLDADNLIKTASAALYPIFEMRGGWNILLKKIILWMDWYRLERIWNAVKYIHNDAKIRRFPSCMAHLIPNEEYVPMIDKEQEDDDDDKKNSDKS